MCGIAGFIGVGDENDLKQMVATLAHRGPDGNGFFVDPVLPVYLGHRRLSVIDIPGGFQPMKTMDQELIITYNGEIYNAGTLRKELEIRGHVFQTDHSDTEVLLHGYREWNTGLMDKLNGMWAFAIFDKREEKLFLSRDRFGQKPLFYGFNRDTFAFASELRAFCCHSKITLNLSKRGLQKYCAYGYFPSDYTAYEGVYKLPAGCHLSVSIKDMKPKVQRYWSYRIEPEDGESKVIEAKWVACVQDLLEKSVKRRLISDVPLGIFLSGGLDSASIAFFANRYVTQGQLRTFSIGFSEPSFDETDSAKCVADLLGSLHSVKIFSKEILPSVLEEVFGKLDEPLSDSSLMSQFLLSKVTRHHVKVALGGDGSDELFAGYDTFKAMQIANIIEKFLPKPVHRGITSLLGVLPRSHNYMSLRFKIQRLLSGIGYQKALWQPLWLSPISSKEINELLGEPVDLEELYSEAIDEWEACRNVGLVDKSLQFYGNIFLQNQILTKVDRTSMMHGLEVRSPFLDIDLVNCICRIPHYYKLRNGHAKYILKKAMEPFLPSTIVWRKKIGFSAPLGKWFSDGSIKLDRGIFNGVADKLIQHKLREHIRLKDDHRLFLWNVHGLMNFMKNNNVVSYL